MIINSILAGSGGGGATLIHTETIDVSGSSETKTIEAGASAWTGDKILFIDIRFDGEYPSDSNHYTGSQIFLDNYMAATNSGTQVDSFRKDSFRHNTDGTFSPVAPTNGIVASKITSDGTITLSCTAQAFATGTTAGDYVVNVYLLDYPDGISPFAV